MVGLAVAGAAVAGVAGSAMQGSAATTAAGEQASAATSAAQLQEQQYQNNIANLQPYNTAGQGMLPSLTAYEGNAQNALTGAYNKAQAAIPQTMTQANLVNTPGYQFNLSQGLKATQNSAAARGLGVSGTALKGAATFATGLADSTYQNQFNNEQTLYGDASQQFSNAYNQAGQGYQQLLGPAQLGESAAAQAGITGQAGAAAAGSNIAGAGTALAQGTNNSAAATAQGLNSLGAIPTSYMTMQALQNSTGAVDSGAFGV
jgi:hypothetical protein